MMAGVVDLAVCVRQWDWSETSQTVSLFCRGHGLIRAVAKGSRRDDRRFSGGIEVGTLGEVVLIIKRAPAMAVLAGWDLRETFAHNRRDLGAFNAAMYVLELMQQMFEAADPHVALFDRLVGALGGLGDPRRRPMVLACFQWSLLEEAGYRPVLDRDVVTGKPLPEANTYAFRPARGGLGVDPRASGASGAAAGVSDGVRSTGGPIWRVRRETVEALRRLASNKRDEGSIAVEAGAVLDRVNRLLASYLREIIGHQPPAMAVVFGSDPGPASGG